MSRKTLKTAVRELVTYRLVQIDNGEYLLFEIKRRAPIAKNWELYGYTYSIEDANQMFFQLSGV